MDIEFQVTTGAPEATVLAVLQRVRRWPGIVSAVQVMPEATAPDLRLVCVAQVEPAAAAAVLDRLRADPNIEHAEIAAGRGLP